MFSSTQESNMYVNGGSEEEWMNRLADAMIPYLNASAILILYHIFWDGAKVFPNAVLCT